jgi:hypothetical protein
VGTRQYYRPVRPEHAQDLDHEPDLLQAYLQPFGGDADSVQRLVELNAPAPIIEQARRAARHGEGLHPVHDADKSWHALSTLLAGTALDGAIQGLVPLGDPHDSARLVPADAVKRFSEAFDGSSELVRQRFDAAELDRQRIYPGIWDAPERVEYLVAHLEGIAEVYEWCAERGLPLLTWTA